MIREQWPSAIVTVCTGQSIVRERFLIGDAIDRAVKMIRRQQSRAAETERAGATDDVRGIYVDDLSAELLSGRFAIKEGPDGRTLISETARSDETRPSRQAHALLRPRARSGGHRSCTGHDVGAAQPAGRLDYRPTRHRQVPRAARVFRRQELRGQPLTVLLGRGDPLTIGSPYGALSQAPATELWSFGQRCQRCGSGYAAGARRLGAALRGWRDSRHAAASLRRVSAFLGELVGLRFPDDHSMQLRVARSDPKIMGDQVAQALLDYLGAIAQPAAGHGAGRRAVGGCPEPQAHRGRAA